MKPLCIYHGNCADGFGAAWAVRYALGADGVEFHAGIYQDPPPDVAGRDVILVDFSYKRPVIEAMVEKATSVLILDHHKSAAEDLAGLAEPPSWEAWLTIGEGERRQSPALRVAALFDMNRSGAGIAWDYFHPSVPRPRLINHLEDRDLWRFRLAGTREIQAVVFSHPYDFEVWDELVYQCEAYPHAMIREGAAIERKHHKDVAELVGVCQRRMVIGGYAVPVASLPYTLTSDAGHLMAQGEPFAACYWDTPDGRVFSLRSTEEGLDVSEIAKLYGGGGHARAAGFRVPYAKVGHFDVEVS